jgi:hypothetical protein
MDRLLGELLVIYLLALYQQLQCFVTSSDEKITAFNQIKVIWEEEAVAYFKALSWMD